VRTRRIVTGAVAAAALAGGVTGAHAATSKPKPKTVKVFDNYYGPAKLTVKPGTKVTWKWPSDIGDSHDVKTRSVPKGAKKFQSPPYAAQAKWSQVFKKPGKYKLYCTFHETEMTMTIIVKKG
jgi:plastocyanin